MHGYTVLDTVPARGKELVVVDCNGSFPFLVLFFFSVVCFCALTILDVHCPVRFQTSLSGSRICNRGVLGET